MGLITKTKEYLIRIFDYTIAKCRVTTDKAITQIAMASFFLANKFEGDHNFDYRLFRKIIDRFEVAFFEVQLAECKIMKAIDMSIFYQSTIFDYIRSIVERLDVKSSSLLDGYYRYMDNVYLYVLMTDQYKYDIALTCLILTLIYFTARSNSETIAGIYRLIASTVGTDKKNAQNLDKCKSFVLKKLGELGSKEVEVSFLEKQIDFEAYLKEASKMNLTFIK